MIYKATVSGDIKTAAKTIGGQLQTSQLTMTGGLHINESLPAYEGPYEVTPSASVQELQTAHKNASENIIINPIPSNYGLITWDGSTLTVS